jgi:hypothetical protein
MKKSKPIGRENSWSPLPLMFELPLLLSGFPPSLSPLLLLMESGMAAAFDMLMDGWMGILGKLAALCIESAADG